MKDYNWIEYQKIGLARSGPSASMLRVSIVKTKDKHRRFQVVFYIPEHVCRSSGFFVGERVNVRWTEDKKLASIYRCKNGYKLSLSGGVKKGETGKAFGSFDRATVKISLDEVLKSVFFRDSFEAYAPEIESISNGEVVFKILAK